MSRGEIVEQGTHDVLYARDGMYRGLVDAQRISAQGTEDGTATPEDDTDDDIHRSFSGHGDADLLRRTTTGQSSRSMDARQTSGVVEKKKYSGAYLLKRVLHDQCR
jgi:hypothetical protein